MIKVCRLGLLCRSPAPCLPRALSRSLTVERTNCVSVTMDPEFAVAVVKMQKPPVNSLCSNHLLELQKTFTDLENNENVRAVIITSGLPGVFCAGLDFMNLYERTFNEIYAFWNILQDTYIKMYSSPLINIAAINGHCIAGACGFTSAADYRIFAEGSKIGMNEVIFGVPVPHIISQMIEDLVGFRETDKLQQLGTVMTSSEALQLGFVDEVVPMEEVLPAAKKHVATWLEIPDVARAMNKGGMRKNRTESFIARKETDSRFYASLLGSSQIKAMMKRHMESLKDKTK